MLFIYFQRDGKGGRKERWRNIDLLLLAHTPTRTEATAQAHVLTEN